MKEGRAMGRIDGKVALVTGAASGIGAACAQALAREGAGVALGDVQEAKGAALAEKIGAGGGKAVFLRHDVTSEEDWIEIVAEVERAFGRLDILVNNAGIAIGAASITAMSLADWRRQQAVNVEGVFLGLKHALPAMRRAGNGGSIVNMSSVAGLKGSPTLAAYSATKGAVRLLTKSVALECAAAKDGVRVNSVHPGIIETPIWESIAGMGQGGANAPPDLDALSAMAVPMGVKGLPEDIANAVLWLASDEARYVTGAEIVVDGGLSVR
jgi:NAD(P)-dependent dehydrogenase (short-subunit alcohol dehydrogenase family)